MHKGNYSSRDPRSPRRFMKMPRKEVLAPREPEPKLPTCYEQIRAGMEAACSRDQSANNLPARWKELAAELHQELRTP